MATLDTSWLMTPPVGWGEGRWLTRATDHWGDGITVVGLPANILLAWAILWVLAGLLLYSVSGCVRWLYRTNKKLETASEDDIMDNRSLRAIRRARDMTDIRNLRRTIRSIRKQRKIRSMNTGDGLRSLHSVVGRYVSPRRQCGDGREVWVWVWVWVWMWIWMWAEWWVAWWAESVWEDGTAKREGLGS